MSASSTGRVPLVGALLLALASALVLALLPAGVALDRRIDGVLRATAIEDLGRAPMILEDRTAAREEALTMHAMSVATTAGVAEALAAGRGDEALAMASATAAMYGEDPVLVAPDGSWLAGPPLPDEAVEEVRRGGAPVLYLDDGDMPRSVALAPVGGGASEEAAGWMGIAGTSVPMDSTLATTLAALARADVTLIGADGRLVASTLSADTAQAVTSAVAAGAARALSEKVDEVMTGVGAIWVAPAEVPGAGTVLFTRAVDEELAALPGVRRSALLAGALTLVLALGVGVVVALSLARPVGGLAAAAGRVAEGDFAAPVPASNIEELDRLGRAFRTMRTSLQARLAELAEANTALEDRQRRLAGLQAELIRQDRLASSARMAAELAHEIRNPVANVRNCLEVVRRGLPEGSESTPFVDMAIDELLRMHELAEHLLDLNRPIDPGAGDCDPVEVARQVAMLAAVGDTSVEVDVRADPGVPRVPIPPDALKQILFNLVDNAREAAGSDRPIALAIRVDPATVTLDVLDRGPGIDPEVAAHLFDPFFTTKDAVTGVGLGLFVAEGLARRYGGRMEAGDRDDGPGARFRVELPRQAAAPGAADPESAEPGRAE
ncbi:sensor histidine kinase [Gaopeijia maritima]|uniref:histidine kinase n=1 Tax=Gaopeijia maritima TaxID=3119007 RepID=A0ABU9ECY1_9BACT